MNDTDKNEQMPDPRLEELLGRAEALVAPVRTPEAKRGGMLLAAFLGCYGLGIFTVADGLPTWAQFAGFVGCGAAFLVAVRSLRRTKGRQATHHSPPHCQCALDVHTYEDGHTCKEANT